MAIIGLLLLLLAVALVIGVVVDNNVQVIFSVFGTTIDQLTVAGLFVAGVLTGLLGLLGLWMMKVGAARSRRRRLIAREERDRERSSIEQLALEREQLAEEKAQLEAQLQRERGRAATARPSGPTGARSATRVPSSDPARRRPILGAGTTDRRNPRPEPQFRTWLRVSGPARQQFATSLLIQLGQATRLMGLGQGQVSGSLGGVAAVRPHAQWASEPPNPVFSAAPAVSPAPASRRHHQAPSQPTVWPESPRRCLGMLPIMVTGRRSAPRHHENDAT